MTTMTRVNVYRTEDDGYQTRDVLDGWFDLHAATSWSEDTRWDGSNHISIPTGSQWAHQNLWRTKGGRWVLHEWSQWQGSKDIWRFIGDGAAREWLIVNGHDDAVAEHFGPIDEESGPDPRPGRPEIGAAINVRLGDELLGRVDDLAAANGISRAEALRWMVRTGLDALK